MHQKQTRIRLLAPLTILLVAIGVLGVRLPMAIADRAGDYAMFDPVVDVEHLVSRKFFRELSPEDYKKMQEGAIRGMLEVLDDKYTEYIPTESIADFDKAIRGEYAGIGAEVNTRDGFLMIASPMEDSPAYRAGIEADDLVIAVDGKTTWQEPIDATIARLTGTPGTTVNLTLERVGDKSSLPPGAKAASVPDALGEAPGPKAGSVRFDLDIQRERILASTVKGVRRIGDKWSFMLDPEQKIGYIRITQFTGSTIPELEAACRQLLAEHMRGLILDLRFNGGGSLGVAIEMADLFLKGGTIVSTKGRATAEERYTARPEGTLPDFPMVVLANDQSASASEIIAGALSDNGRAVVLGTRTFGKGIVQAMYRLPSGAGQLKITEQYYYLPSGRCIQRTDESTDWGVDPAPGMYVPMTNDEYREMLRARRGDEIIRNGKSAASDDAAHWDDPAWILEHFKDKQLRAAVQAIRGKLSTEQWPIVGEDPVAGTLHLAAFKQEERRYELLMRELARSSRRMEALRDEAAGVKEDDTPLLPSTAELTGGSLKVLDANGEEIATLTITGADLARWLEGAPVERKKAAEPAATAPTESDGSKK